MVELTGSNFIAGEESKKGEFGFYAVNPRTKEATSLIFSEATSTEIDLALVKAFEAFKLMRTFPVKKIAKFLNAVAEEIMALGEE